MVFVLHFCSYVLLLLFSCGAIVISTPIENPKVNTTKNRNGSQSKKIINNLNQDKDYYTLAVQAIRNNNFSSAIFYLSKSIESTESKSLKAISYTQMGNVYQKLSNWKQAELYYKKSIFTDDSFIQAYEQLYLLYKKQHNDFEASKVRSKIISIDPKNKTIQEAIKVKEETKKKTSVLSTLFSDILNPTEPYRTLDDYQIPDSVISNKGKVVNNNKHPLENELGDDMDDRLSDLEDDIDLINNIEFINPTASDKSKQSEPEKKIEIEKKEDDSIDLQKKKSPPSTIKKPKGNLKLLLFAYGVFTLRDTKFNYTQQRLSFIPLNFLLEASPFSKHKAFWFSLSITTPLFSANTILTEQDFMFGWNIHGFIFGLGSLFSEAQLNSITGIRLKNSVNDRLYLDFKLGFTLGYLNKVFFIKIVAYPRYIVRNSLSNTGQAVEYDRSLLNFSIGNHPTHLSKNVFWSIVFKLSTSELYLNEYNVFQYR